MTWLDLAPADAAQAIADWVAARGLPAFRARQIQPYLWERPVPGWLAATDLPRELVTALDRDQSLELLHWFLEHCLPLFGTYQDAMTKALGVLLNGL